ncbi:hypothetical protein [Streptomyces sp. RLB1-9]|nr:hypothetical protein [Streptomyces sp. RLB1-9]
MSYLRAFLVRRLRLPYLHDDMPDWHVEYSTAQLWRWYEQVREVRR